MLVLRRKDGQWIEVTHRSGDVLRFRVYDVSGEAPGRVNLAFDDADHNFAIQRPERALKGPHFTRAAGAVCEG
jgi:hypothetical protein